MTGSGGRRRARDGGGAYGGTGPDQRRDNGSGRDDYRYSSAAAGGDGGSRPWPPHEYERGGPGRANSGGSAAFASAHAQPHWERDRSRERGDGGMGGSGWDWRDRGRYPGAGGGGGSEFGSDPLAMAGRAAGVTRAGTGAGAGGNINYGPVDAFGRTLQPSMLGRSQTDSGTYGGGGASTSSGSGSGSASASTSKASLGRSSSAAAAVSRTKEYLQNIGGKAGIKQGGSTIGGRSLPWQRDAGASAAANRPPTPPLPPGGKLPPPRSKAAATAAAAAAVRPRHSSSQQQVSNSKDYNDYLRSVQKRSSHNAGGGGAGRNAQTASTSVFLGRMAAESAATVDRLKAISAGNPKASAATAAAGVSSTATTNTSMAAKPPADVGGASAKNAPLPDMKKAASVARMRHPTRNELLQSIKPLKNNLASRVGTKAKHPPPSGSGAVSPARGNRLLLAKVDKPTKKTMARKVQGATAKCGGQTSTSSMSGSPRGQMETQKQPVQQVASNKPSAKRVGRAAAAMSKENHSMPHQHDGPVEVCAVGKQHTGRIIPTVSAAPKFVQDASVKLPGEGKGDKAAKAKPKPSTGKAKAKVAKATNKVTVKIKAVKDGIAKKAKAFSHPQVTAALSGKSSPTTSDGSPSPRGKVPILPNSGSHSTSGEEKNDPSKSSVSAGTDKSSYSSMEEAQARLVAKKKPQLVLEGKIQESGTVSTLPKAPSDDLPGTASTKGSADAEQAPKTASIDGTRASAAKTNPTGETSGSSKRTCVAKAGPNDVFCGSGSHFAINSLEGNKKYRALIQEHQEIYLKADDAEREKIARSIVTTIHGRGGRFLEKVSGRDSQFCIVDDDKALGETMINFYVATTASQDKAKVTDGKKEDGSTIDIGKSHTNYAAKLPSSSPSAPSKDVDGEEKKDDEPDGGSVDGPTKSKNSEDEAPDVVLVDQASKMREVSETKFVTKDDSGEVLDIDGDSTNGSDDDDVICIDDSPDQVEKVYTEKTVQKKKASTDNDSVISIGSSSSSASSSSSDSNASSAMDSEVEVVGVKKSEEEVRVRSTKAWVCDICNVAEFTDEEDAIAHENVCTCRPSIADASGTADTGNTTLNTSEIAAQTDVSAPSEASARAQGTTNEKDDEYDSSDDERSLKMKPIEFTALESSQSSSEGGGDRDIPTTIDVKAPSTPKSSDKPMLDTPMTHASDESDEEDDVPTHKNTSPPRLSTKAKTSPLKEHYVGSSERLAMKASMQANDEVSKKRALDQSKAVGLDDPKEKKKKQRRLSSSSGGKKKALAKTSPLAPITLGRGPNELIMMEAVPHLTRTELDNVTGKPVHFITVYSSTMGKCHSLYYCSYSDRLYIIIFP